MLTGQSLSDNQCTDAAENACSVLHSLMWCPTAWQSGRKGIDKGRKRAMLPSAAFTIRRKASLGQNMLLVAGYVPLLHCAQPKRQYRIIFGELPRSKTHSFAAKVQLARPQPSRKNIYKVLEFAHLAAHRAGKHVIMKLRRTLKNTRAYRCDFWSDACCRNAITAGQISPV